jgi:VIT1/CCC1 family predicted Fe2+/Mn2+ transporter
MVLTFTLAAGFVAGEGAQGVRGLLIATLGCNIAWGIIDGAMYVMTSLMHRGHRMRFIAAIQSAPDEQTKHRIVAAEMDDALAARATAGERNAIHSAIVSMAGHAHPHRLRVTREDWLGALNCFVLVVGSTLPAALPFLFIHDDPHLALRVSNHLLVAMLFVVGFAWAKFTGLRPWVSGLGFLLASLILVYVAIALGG